MTSEIGENSDKHEFDHEEVEALEGSASATDLAKLARHLGLEFRPSLEK